LSFEDTHPRDGATPENSPGIHAGVPNAANNRPRDGRCINSARTRGRINPRSASKTRLRPASYILADRVLELDPAMLELDRIAERWYGKRMKRS
jgi:hypothetical protein